MNGGSSIQLLLHLARGSSRLFFMNRNMALGGSRVEKPIGSVLRVSAVPARQKNVRINDVPYHRVEFVGVTLMDEMGRLAVVQGEQSRFFGR